MPTDSQDLKTVKRAAIAQTVIQAGMLAELDAQRRSLAEQTELLKTEQADREEARAAQEGKESELARWRSAVAETEVAMGGPPVDALNTLLWHVDVLMRTPEQAPLPERVQALKLLDQEARLLVEAAESSSVLADMKKEWESLQLRSKMESIGVFLNVARDEEHTRFEVAFNRTLSVSRIEDAEAGAEQYLEERARAIAAVGTVKTAARDSLARLTSEGRYRPIALALFSDFESLERATNVDLSMLEADVDEKRRLFVTTFTSLRALADRGSLGQADDRDVDIWRQLFTSPDRVFDQLAAPGGFVDRLSSTYREISNKRDAAAVRKLVWIGFAGLGLIAFGFWVYFAMR